MDRTASLLADLRPHRAEDEIERTFVARTLDLLAATGDPFDRARYDPGHVTSSGYVLSPRGDEMLLIRHAVVDRWLQPGGHVEADDPNVVAAARREILEETGLEDLVFVTPSRVPFDLDIHRIPARGAHPAHDHFDVRYLFRSRSRAIRSGSDAGEVLWVSLDRVGELLSGESSARVLRKVRRVTAV